MQEEPAFGADLVTQRSNYDTGRQLISEHDQDGQFESLSSRSTVMDDYDRAVRSPAMQAASKMNLKILKYDINRHQRIKFGRLESLLQLPIFRSCRSNEKNRILRLGEEKVNEEINVLRMVKTCRQAESLLKMFKLDKNVFLERNKSNQIRLDQRGEIPEAKIW